MKILLIALRASFPAILLTLLPSTVVVAQAPSGAITQPPIPAVPVSIDSAQNPSQALLNSAVPVQAPAPWYDSLFKQKLPIDFGFRIGESHSDNIFFEPVKTPDYITEISPTVILTLGQAITLVPQLDQETIDDKTNAAHLNYFQLTYRPTLILYARNSDLDDVDEYADAVYSHQFARLTLSLEQSYEKLSQPTVQLNAVGSLVHRDIYTTTARANYIYSDQLSTYGTFTQTVNSYVSAGYTDNTEWQADYYFLYQLFPKMSVGFGPRIGFDDIDQAANQSSQAALVHLAFIASGKVHFEGAAGAEVRQFEHDASPERVTPIVEATATYQPFDSMTISLDGERHRYVSNGQIGTDYTASIAALHIRQRLFQVLFFTLGAGYENDQYTAFGAGPVREDDISYVNGGIEWASYRGLTIDAGYQYLRDDSNINAFTFNESRATISASYKY